MKTEAALIAHLKKTLSPARFAHTLAVARWARSLARRYGVPERKAWRAGLLHDLAKEMSGPALARYVKRRRLAVPGRAEILRRRQLGLLHAYVSADRARREWGETDAAVLRAVAAHTLGGLRMTALEKILYVADFSSPDRKFPQAAPVRRAAGRNLDGAVRLTAGWKIRHAVEGGGYLHPETVKMWNALS